MLLFGHVTVAQLVSKSLNCAALFQTMWKLVGGWERVVQTGFLKMDSSYVAAR